MASLKSRPAAAALAWSPLGPYLAAGSAAGAIDVTFSSASSLEVGRVFLFERRREREKRKKKEEGEPKQSNGKKNECDVDCFPSLLFSLPSALAPARFSSLSRPVSASLTLSERGRWGEASV